MKCTIDILGKDGGREPVLGPVIDLYRFFERVDFDDRKDGAKDLFPFEGGTGLDTIEQSRLVEEALSVHVGDRRTDQGARAFLLTDLHIIVDALQGGPVDDGADFNFWIKPIPESQFLRPSQERFLEPGGNPFLDNQTAGGRAALTGCPERGPQGCIRHQIQISIIQDDDRILAAHLEGNLFVQAGQQTRQWRDRWRWNQ